MTEKVEGTIILDGLLEGPLVSPQVEDDLRDWVARAADRGLHFSLSVDGGTFSLLAANRPVPADRLGAEPAETIEEALRDLQSLLPPEAKRGLFSTLRSTEYAQGRETQTLYVLGPDGAFRRGQRTIEAETSAPPQPLTRKEKLKMAGMGLAVAALALLASSLFVDYPALYRSAVEGFTPLNPEGVKVETGPFADYFTVEKKAASSDAKAVLLTLKRTKGFPLTADDCQRLLDGEAGKKLASRLAVESLAQGYVRCEMFGKDNAFLGAAMARVAPLREKETCEVAIPLPANHRPTRIVIGY